MYGGFEILMIKPTVLSNKTFFFFAKTFIHSLMKSEMVSSNVCDIYICIQRSSNEQFIKYAAYTVKYEGYKLLLFMQYISFLTMI